MLSAVDKKSYALDVIKAVARTEKLFYLKEMNEVTFLCHLLLLAGENHWTSIHDSVFPLLLDCLYPFFTAFSVVNRKITHSLHVL
jgi:hypothetical protein